MIKKREETIQAADIQPASPDANRATPSLIPPILCTIAYTLCALLMTAPLTRIIDPVVRLQLPFGAALAQVGGWLPINLGLSSNALASQTNTSLLEFMG